MNDSPPIKVKRGRKTKKEMNEKKEKEKELVNIIIETHEEESTIEETHEKEEILENSNQETTIDSTKSQAKKRGRKPKGGKIIQQLIPSNTNKEPKPSVILHLKCSVKDLQKQHFSLPDMEPFSFNNTDLGFELLNHNYKNDTLDNDTTVNYKSGLGLNICSIVDKKGEDNDDDYNEIDEEDKNSFIKGLWKKLKQLEQKLHLNNVGDKKSACFWCTHDFDNPPIYIPKHYIKDTYHVYGCFCSPECATAFLMEENVDSSTKFERYHLLNHIYSKIYNYTKNIKPAPSPFYMLNKYYGNLSIQEFRSLLKNDRLFLIVDKPLTRILPELHEDNEDFIINNKIIPSNGFQVKKKIQRKAINKSTILNEKFGIGT